MVRTQASGLDRGLVEWVGANVFPPAQPQPLRQPHPSHSPTTSSRTSFQWMWLPVSCSRVTVIRLWMPCQAPGERKCSDGLGAPRRGAQAGRGRECFAPGGAGRSPCMASRCGGPPLQECNCKREMRPQPKGENRKAAPPSGERRPSSPRRPESAGRGDLQCITSTTPGVPLGDPCPQQAWDSLAIGLQLTDLEVDQQVVLAVAGSGAGPR